MRRGNPDRTVGALAVVALLVVALAIVAMFVLAAPAAGHQMPCGPASEIRARLAEKFGEQINAQGVHVSSNLAELWVDDAGGSWTLLIVTPRGIACLAAAGDGWEAAPPVPAPTREG